MTKIGLCLAVAAATTAAGLAAFAATSRSTPTTTRMSTSSPRASAPMKPAASSPERRSAEATTPVAADGEPDAAGSDRAPRGAVGQGRREVRAVWVTRFSYRRPRDIRRMMRAIAGANLNVVYFQVRGAGDAYYRSHFEPWAQRLTGRLGRNPGWDPLKTAVEAAHANGLKLHAYINVYALWQGNGRRPPLTRPRHTYYRRGWRVATRVRVNGRWVYRNQRVGDDSYLWASPGNPAVRDHIYRVAMDIVSNYDIDGLHYDRIRYPGPRYSWDAASRRRYAIANNAYRRAHGGRRLSRARWQRLQIDALVAQIYRGVKAVNPKVQVSAAAWGIYTKRWGWPACSDGLVDYYQDSQRWARTGTVDALAPMTYWSIRGIPHWNVLVRDFVRHRGPAQIWPGIAAYKFRNNWGEVARQVRLSRRLRAQGVSFYDYDALRGRWANLRRLFPTRVAPPVRGLQTRLSAEATPLVASVGATVTVWGALLPKQAGAVVGLRKYATTRWDLVNSTTADITSRYALSFKPAAAGVYRMRVVFRGDADHAGTISRDLVIRAR